MAANSPRQTDKNTQSMRHTVNVRLLLISLVVFAVVAISGFFWYRVQAEQLGALLLERAEQYESDQEWGKASEYYQRYLISNPDDSEVLVRLVEAYSQGEMSPARQSRLITLLYRALGRAPDRSDLRLMLADNLLKLNAFADAEAEATAIIEAGTAPNPEAQKIVAIARFVRSGIDTAIDRASAINELVSVAEQLPGDAELIAVTASALRNNPTLVETGDVTSATLADQFIDRLVETNPEDVSARLVRYSYRSENKLPDAEADLEKALELDPDNVEALVLSSRTLLISEPDAERYKSVEASLRRAIELAPLDSRAYFLLAALYDQTDRPDLAIDLLQRGGEATGFTLEFDIEAGKRQLAGKLIDEAAKTIAHIERESVVYLADKPAAARAVFENEITLLQARLALAQGKSQEAVRRLETMLLTSALKGNDKGKQQWLQAAGLLAGIEESEGRWDRATELRSEIAERAPLAPLAIQAAADGKLRMGDYRAAISLIEGFAKRAEATDDMRVLLVRAQLALQASRPSSDRIWSEFDRVLADAKANLTDRWEVVIAEASALITREKSDEAAELIRGAEQSFADNLEFCRAASIVYEQLGKGYAEDLTRLLKSHAEAASSAIEHAEFEIAMLVRQQRMEEAKQRLDEIQERVTAEDRPRLDQLRAGLLAANGENDAALDLFAKLIVADPQNVEVLKSASEFAIRVGDMSRAETWTSRLVEVTNNNDDARYLKSLLELSRYADLKPADRSQLEEAVSQLRLDRPQWSNGAALAGAVSVAKGDNRQALTDYRTAVNLGDRSPATLQALIVLLYQFGRLKEAEETNDYLDQISPLQSADPFVDKMAVELAIAQDRPEVAIDRAEQTIARRPDDPIAHIRLANLLVRERREAEALQVLRDAAKQIPGNDQIWTALFSTMVRAGQVDEARKVLAALVNSPVLPAEQRHEIAAQGYELIGDRLAARRQYELALAQQPSRIDVRLKYAQLLASVAPASARREYEQILQVDPENQPAARGLAMQLAATGRPEDWERASKLLESQGADPANAAEADRLRVMLLVNQGRTRAEKIANCRLAEEILRGLFESGDAQANVVDRRLYSQLLERQARLTGEESTLIQAKQQWQLLADGTNVSTESLSAYVEFLIRHCRTDSLNRVASSTGTSSTSSAPLRDLFVSEAEQRIDQLAKLQGNQPAGLEQLTIVLAARLQRASGQSSEARQTIDEYASSYQNTSDPQLLQTIGQMYASIEAHAEAEIWFRRLMQQNPAAYILVVQSLVAQGKRSAAAALAMESAGPQRSPEEAVLLASVLTTTGDPAESLPEAESAIAVALESFGEQVNLLQAAAVMKASRGEYDDAIEIFRKIIQLDPENTLALNNLATLLAERPNQRAEALQYIETALSIAGRDPMLLDTQGTIHLKLDDADNAVACLEEATAGGVADARYYLHLAAAYRLAGRTEDATEALGESRLLGLENFVLTGDDREMLDRLDSELTGSN